MLEFSIGKESLYDNIVIGVFDDLELNSYLNTQELVDYVKVNKIKEKELIVLPSYSEKKKYYLVGLGKKEQYSITKLKKSLCKMTYKLFNNASIIIDSFVGTLDIKDVVNEAVLTICEYNYRFNECKSKKENNDLSIQFVSKTEVDYSEAFNLANSIADARDLINMPYNYLNASQLSEFALQMVEEIDNSNLTIEVLDKEEIEKLNLGAFLAVNKGSKDEPKLIYLKYQGESNDTPPLALVGKGIMFDSGGYSIKTSMNDMKDDMSGAATIIGVMGTLAKNNVKANVIGIVCATDNRIDGGALLPDDVITSGKGKTIEIVSTDAEGRLTLADAVYFAQEKGAKEVIDVATLTGACVVALGEDVTGAFTNNQEMLNKFIKASKTVGEDVWQLPITEKIINKVRGSSVADLTNSTGRGMGASGAAAFIQEFIDEDTKWIHLDIAGTSFSKSPSDGKEYGATGVMVRTIYQYITKER